MNKNIVSASKVEYGIATSKEEATLKNSSTGFFAVPIDEEKINTINGNYWQINTVPNKEITLKIKIINSDKKNNFLVSVNQAATNSNLVVDYNLTQKKIKSSFYKQVPLNFNNAAKVAGNKNHKVIRLDSHETAIIPIKIKIPKNNFNGSVVGGVNITKSMTPAEEVNLINNTFRFTYAVVLNQGKHHNQNTNLKTNFTNNSKFNNILNFNVTNKNMNILQDIKAVGTVTQGIRSISSVKLDKGTITPLTRFSLKFAANNPWKTGEYNLKLKIYSNKRVIKNINQTFYIKPNGKIIERKNKSIIGYFKYQRQKLLQNSL